MNILTGSDMTRRSYFQAFFHYVHVCMNCILATKIDILMHPKRKNGNTSGRAKRVPQLEVLRPEAEDLADMQNYVMAIVCYRL